MNSKLRSLLPFVVALVIGVVVGFVLDEPKTTSRAGAAESDSASLWTCAMHPQVQQPQPGACPLCGMDLIPLGAKDSGTLATNQVALSKRAQRLAQIQTQKLVLGDAAEASITLLGSIEADENSLRTVTVWTSGRVDKLLVRETGQKVRSGQSIATLYSPEIYAAHQELLVASKHLASIDEGYSNRALGAARKKLELLGLNSTWIQKLEAMSSPIRAIPITTPYSGTIIVRSAREGEYLKIGQPLYKIANLQKLWVQLDAYEHDLEHIQVGQGVKLVIQGYGGEKLDAKISFIDPVLDPKMRTTKVRVELRNRDARLKPGMFVRATLQIRDDAKAPLMIPDTAPLLTGKRAVVYVQRQSPQGEGVVYEARQVMLGRKMGTHYPVMSGLVEGERVVVRGAFVLDADLQIRGGASMMNTVGQNAMPEKLSKGSEAQHKGLVLAYLRLQEALASDGFGTAQEVYGELPGLLKTRKNADEETWIAMLGRIDEIVKQGEQSKDIEASRAHFEHLSRAIAESLQYFGNPTDERLLLSHCPMAFGDRGASWVQRDGETNNAYFGVSMRECGSVEFSVEPGQYLMSSSSTPSSAVSGHAH